MFIFRDLKSFPDLLFVARNYLAEVAYVGNSVLEIPSELKPFLDYALTDERSLNKQAVAKVVPLQSGNKRALFLDRDGIINVDHGYVGKVEQVNLMPGIAQLISKANHLHMDVNVVTNQSGIGRGYYSEQDYQDVMSCIQRLLKFDEAKLDHIEFAPFHPDAKDSKYHIGREFRKPRPGMILKLHQQFRYDLKNSIMIGDKASDIMAAMVAGVGTVYLFESEQSKEEWMILKNWLISLRKYGLSTEFDTIQMKQLTDFSEVQL